MRSSSHTTTMEQTLIPILESMGFDLVRMLLEGKRRPRLQVMVERRDGDDVSVNDCASISHALSAILDVEDPISSSFVLEVSSPGLDRPLVRLQDYERFKGHQARLETQDLIEGRRRYRGTLCGILNDQIIIAVEDGEYEIPFTAIASAKLAPTDEEVVKSLNRRSSKAGKSDD